MLINSLPEDDCNLNEKLEKLISGIRAYYPGFDVLQEEKIRQVFLFACKKHKGQKRFSGEPYVIHPIESTEILLSIKPDLETIMACLLHDIIEDAEVSPNEIENKFGKKVRFLCEGIEKVSRVQLKEPDKQLENIRKLFLALAQDVRVVFVKLAERIHNLSTLEYVPQHKQLRIAKESLEIYASIAAKLGLFEFKTLIEDYAFQHLHPEEHREISKSVVASRKEQIDFIEKAKDEISETLKKENISLLEIHGRPKNLYSIYLKM